MRSKSRGYYQLNNSEKISSRTLPSSITKPPSSTLPHIPTIPRQGPKSVSFVPEKNVSYDPEPLKPIDSISPVDQSMSHEQKEGENIIVILRVRPMLRFELERGDLHAVSSITPHAIELRAKAGPRRFEFNYVLPETASQQDVFIKSGVPSLLEASLEGYSASIFLYGQTGSGKTYT